MTNANAHLGKVQRYYDANTAGFVFRNGRKAQKSIHRAVWGADTVTREEAFRYAEDAVLKVLKAVAPPSPPCVLDLGCGVGASISYLASRTPLRAVGVTLSPVQAKAAAAHVESVGGTVHCASFLDLPLESQSVDVAYAIEAFVHAPDPARFFAEAARVLRPGGALVVIDDVLTLKGLSATAPADVRALADFRRGWCLGALETVDALAAFATRAGLGSQSWDDWSTQLELGRPRDRLLELFVPLMSRLPLKDPRLLTHVGGVALQNSLRRGLVAYGQLTWRKL